MLAILLLLAVMFLTAVATAVFVHRRKLRLSRMRLPRARDLAPAYLQAFRIYKAKIKRLRKQARRLYLNLHPGAVMSNEEHEYLTLRQQRFAEMRAAQQEYVGFQSARQLGFSALKRRITRRVAA